MTAHGDGDRYLADTGPPTAYPKSQTPPIIALDNKTLIRVGRPSLAALPPQAAINLAADRSLRASTGVPACMNLSPSRLIAGFAGKAAGDDRPTDLSR